ncbi:Fic/DOC family protein [Gordonia sputi]|uniref:protein adenylyltransferase n=1 Tax=Gordonia sputi NBRC 100414 TaxID=1089453 RepID=H5TVL8_9ACTN|nr:Fic/DOC family protein [Gordonia sputi]NKY95990.1 cell filamentation protein Fic [Gordonia sputi]GAB37526.1 hypothetical protein GOSPT_010_00070 [Gordonia sputi NBRC 100414]
MTTRPWDTGDLDRNWTGYFIPASSVLRNLVHATTHDELTDAEVDLSEYRLLELRENPVLTGPRSYDLAHLCAIHRQLFCDVYEWAGEVRTVGLNKGGVAFCPPANIGQPMNHVADEIARSDQLRAVTPDQLPRTVAYLYDYVNFAHPFREGNGRSTREFFDQLLAERGCGLDWERTDSTELHTACHDARDTGDLSGLIHMFTNIIDDHPAY